MVSVITITHNRATLIGDAIQSVLNQTYQDFEYIIVDDGSDDHTQQVVESFVDSRIHYLPLPRLGYLSKLRNHGIRKATGKYIAWLDSDDMWEPAKLEQQVQCLESNLELGFAFCDVKIFHHRQLTQNGIYGLEQIVQGHFFQDFIVGKLTIYFSSTMVIRKACYDKLGELNENLKSGDHDFICRLLLKYPGAIINRPLTMIRRHDSNHSKLAGDLPFREYIQTLKQLFNEQHISKSTYRRMMSRNHYQSGLYYTRKNQSTLARKAYWQSYTTDPSRLKALARFLFPAL